MEETYIPKTIYELSYFPPEETAKLLELFTDEKHPLLLPEYDVIREVYDDLRQVMERGEELSPGHILLTYQKLKESASNTDVVCGWKNAQKKKCGGLCDIEITAFGNYYQCRVDKTHRTPK